MADRVGRLALLAMGEVGKEDALRCPARGLLAVGLSPSFLLATASLGRAASPTATTTVAAVPCGDVNGDGIVDVGDALVVAQFVVGLRQCSQLTYPEACDVNGDGACNIGDALTIAHCEVGLVNCAFTCGPFTCPSTTSTTTTTTRPSTTSSTSSGTTTTTIPSGTADEIHWTVTGRTSVTVDWRGSATVIRYGLTSASDQSVIAQTPSIVPFSSSGPFWEASITGLQENTVYHYSVGDGSDHTFKTPLSPGSAGFTVYAEGDIGASTTYSAVAPIQAMIAAGRPDFVLALGDLTYADMNRLADVDQHFNDVMVWSQDAAYEPAWGNHEWGGPEDDLRNYKGRFAFANPVTDPASPSMSCCGEDWHWFDYGNTRFIAYPEPWDDWGHWYSLMSNGSGTGIMDQARADPNIRFIVTFGHRPAWSTGYHPGDPTLAGYVSNLHATHPKYVLSLNGHSHDYERTDAALTGGVTYVTVGTGGGSLESVHSSGCLWQSCPPPAWSVTRYMHFGVLKLVFGPTSISGQFICGPAGGGSNDITCNPGDVIDTFTIQ